ncbi:hypothetical protein [Lysinibacillus sp. 54212]|uniref:hypothetical protein n=1 Tax=Lysinibacillus sp. 54212 TaxID=3119829 RepID=UPI002FC7CCBF
MSNEKASKIEKWRSKFAALAVALGCLYSAIRNWGDDWFMTALFGLGVIICGTIAFFDMKRN